LKRHQPWNKKEKVNECRVYIAEFTFIPRLFDSHFERELFIEKNPLVYMVKAITTAFLLLLKEVYNLSRPDEHMIISQIK
jgi:hypothetical protein